MAVRHEVFVQEQHILLELDMGVQDTRIDATAWTPVCLVHWSTRRAIATTWRGMSAQLHALDFYARHGFLTEGEVYLDDGIQHVTMHHALTA